MEYNEKKFLVLRYGKNEELKNDTLYMTGDKVSLIDQVNQCKDLGITMEDSDLFQQQIEKTCSKAKQKCGWILRTFYTRDGSFLRYMYNSLA